MAVFVHGTLQRILCLFIFVAPTVADERVGAALARHDQLPLRTKGRYIVGHRGERVKWACVNWYGAYSTTHAVGGLENNTMRNISHRISELGFNCVRMMYSTEGYVNNPLVDNATVAANPDLMGMRFLEIFDRTIESLTDEGLMVIVNNHNSKSGWCCHYSQDEGLWYVPEYSEKEWIASLVFFAARYKENPFVVAIDLRNEVHDFKDTKLDWGSGDPKTDWAAAAVRAGNAVLEVSPDVLIVVMAMCFGMDLRSMKTKPIQNELIYPNRVVYQAHNYLEYQVFDNVSKMFGPYSKLRSHLLVVVILLMLVVGVLSYIWVRLRKPTLPKGSVTLSISAWVALVCFSGTLVSYQMFQLNCKYCTVAAYSDLLPWIIGCSVVGLVAVCVAAQGVRWLLEENSRASADRSPKPSEASRSTADTTTAPAEPESDPEAMVMDERKDVVTTTNLSQIDVSPIAGPAKTSTADLVGEPVSVTDTSAKIASGSPSEDRSDRCLCCAKGWSSCSVGCRYLEPDCRRFINRVWGDYLVTEHVIPFVESEFDVGMCVGLQVVVVFSISILIGLWAYVMMHIVPTYWWMERHLDGLWGFALEEDHPWTAPVWMGEFGQNVRGQYWLNFVRYLSTRDVDFAYWALNGKKYAEGYINGASGDFINYDEPRWVDETFGLLMPDYDTIRYPWMMLDLQALMQSPARWIPEVIPCSWYTSGSCGER